MGRKEMQAVRQHGVPRLRVKAKHLTEIGVEMVDGRVTAVSAEGRPVLDDGRVLDVANVIWCTGFRQTFDWIDLPVVGDDGWPREYRGGVDSAPGLFFCGLSFQYAFSSMVLPGAGRDAAYVVKKIAAPARRRKSLLRPEAPHIGIGGCHVSSNVSTGVVPVHFEGARDHRRCRTGSASGGAALASAASGTVTRQRRRG
jgi:hypothetical protein